MLFEVKLKEIFKNEGFSLIAFIIFLLILTTTLVFFILDEYNPTKYLNLIVVSLIYLMLFWITFQKGMTIKKILWVKANYLKYPDFVLDFFRNRKSKLYQCKQEKLHTLYEEALQLFEISLNQAS